MIVHSLTDQPILPDMTADCDRVNGIHVVGDRVDSVYAVTTNQGLNCVNAADAVTNSGFACPLLIAAQSGFRHILVALTVTDMLWVTKP